MIHLRQTMNSILALTVLTVLRSVSPADNLQVKYTLHKSYSNPEIICWYAGAFMEAISGKEPLVLILMASVPQIFLQYGKSQEKLQTDI